MVHYDMDDLLPNTDDHFTDKTVKKLKKLFYTLSKREIKNQVKFKSYFESYLNKIKYETILPLMNNLEISNYKVITDLHNTQNSIFQIIEILINKSDQKVDLSDVVNSEFKKIQDQFDNIRESSDEIVTRSINELYANTRNNLQLLLTDIENINANRILRRDRKFKDYKRKIEKLNDLPRVWLKNSGSLLNTLLSDLITQKVKSRLLANTESLKT